TTVTLPGIGSYVALAIEKQNLRAIGYAVLTMLLVIIVYDQLLFRPLVAWADKFRFEQIASGDAPESWILDLFRRSRALGSLTFHLAALIKASRTLQVPLRPFPGVPPGKGRPQRTATPSCLHLFALGTVTRG